MSMLQNTAPVAGVEEEKDTLGSRGPLESDIYPCKIMMAYLSKSAGGALSVNLQVKTPKGEFRQSLWVTSGDAKGNKNTFKNKDGVDQYLPGHLIATSICELTVGKKLHEMAEEEKVIKLYSYEEKKEVNTNVVVLTELIDQEFYGGVQKVLEDKNVKGQDGIYRPSGEVRAINELDKVFGTDKLTSAERRANATEPTWFNTWLAKNKGVDRNNVKGASPAAGTPGAPMATAKPTESLFTKTA